MDEPVENPQILEVPVPPLDYVRRGADLPARIPIAGMFALLVMLFQAVWIFELFLKDLDAKHQPDGFAGWIFLFWPTVVAFAMAIHSFKYRGGTTLRNAAGALAFVVSSLILLISLVEFLLIVLH